MKNKRILSLSPVERLLRKSGAERVSPKAVEYLADTLEDMAKDIGSQATVIAKHAKRKTITDKDIRLVTK